MSGLLAFGFRRYSLLEVQLEQEYYYQPILQRLILRKTLVYPVLSGVNWRRAEKGADRTIQCLCYLMAASFDLVPVAVGL